MEKRRIKQCVGIDCGLEELVTSFGVLDKTFRQDFLSNTAFDNQVSGFKKLLSWAGKLAEADVELTYVIEATGVYSEKVCLFLHQHNQRVVLLLPNKAKAFSRTLSVKTSTDKVSAKMLAQFGLEKQLAAWQPAQEIFRNLRRLSRERDQLIQQQTVIKNQVHAESHGAWPSQPSLKRMKQRLVLLKKQILQIEAEIKELVDSDDSLKERVEKICTVKGLRLLTVATVLGETNGFNLFRNKKQLTSYAGIDPVERQSGISVRGKSRISKKGNKYLRKCLFLPALAAQRHNPTMLPLYTRLVDKHGIKMKASVAVQRKLLELIYILWVKNEAFDPDYKKNEGQPREAALAN